jgi:hypothetical protein
MIIKQDHYSEKSAAKIMFNMLKVCPAQCHTQRSHTHRSRNPHASCLPTA